MPVLRTPVLDADVPEEIRQRNWIPFTDNEDFDSSVERIVRAVDTDLELCKEHTRWLVKALEWSEESQDRSFLLRGSELKAAEEWLASVPPDADPTPTVLQSEYLLASRRAATRRQRALLATTAVIAAIAVGLGVVALVSRAGPFRQAPLPSPRPWQRRARANSLQIRRSPCCWPGERSG